MAYSGHNVPFKEYQVTILPVDATDPNSQWYCPFPSCTELIDASNEVGRHLETTHPDWDPVGIGIEQPSTSGSVVRRTPSFSALRRTGHSRSGSVHRPSPLSSQVDLHDTDDPDGPMPSPIKRSSYYKSLSTHSPSFPTSPYPYGPASRSISRQSSRARLSTPSSPLLGQEAHLGAEGSLSGSLPGGLEGLQLFTGPSPSRPHSPVVDNHASSDVQMEVEPEASLGIPTTVEAPGTLLEVGLAILQPMGIVVCLHCSYGVPFKELANHLKRDHSLTQSQCSRAVLRLQERTDIVINYADYTIPTKPPFPVAVSILNTLQEAYVCSICGHINQREAHVKSHIGKVHPSATRAEVLTCQVQTLFNPRHPGGGGYCRVVPAPPPPDEELPIGELVAKLMKEYEEVLDPPIIPIDRKLRDTSIFSEKSGFAKAVEGLTVKDVTALQSTYAATKEMNQDIRELVSEGWRHFSSDNYNARCHILSPTETISKAPFDRVTESLDRYSGFWAQFLTFVIDNFHEPVASRRFQLNQQQGSLVQEYLVNASREDEEVEDIEDRTLERRWILARLSTELVCCRIETDAERLQHPLVFFTILHSYRSTGNFANPRLITPFIAGIQYMCRHTIWSACLMLYLGEEGEGQTLKKLCHKWSSEWLREAEDTPFGWERQMMHLASAFAFKESAVAQFWWDKNNAHMFWFNGDHLSWVDFGYMVRRSAEVLRQSFDLLWKQHLGLPAEWMQFDWDDVADEPGRLDQSFNFTKSASNAPLAQRQNDILNHIYASGKFCQKVGGSIWWNAINIRKLLGVAEHFMKHLLVACYLCGGQPPRGTELCTTLAVNTATLQRNVVVMNGAAHIITFLNKTSFNTQRNKPTPHTLPKCVSDILLAQVAFLSIIFHRLEFQLDESTPERMDRQRRFLFAVNGKVLATEQLSQSLNDLCVATLGTPDKPLADGGLRGTRYVRQLFIFGSQRYLKCVTEDEQSLVDLQAGHTSEIARRFYGVEGGRLSDDLANVAIDEFEKISRKHHVMFGLDKLPGLDQPLPEGTNFDVPMPVSLRPALDVNGVPMLEPPLLSEDEDKPGGPVDLARIDFEAKSLLVQEMMSVLKEQIAQNNASLIHSFKDALQTAQLSTSRPEIPIPTTIVTSSPATCVSADTFAAFRRLIPSGQFKSVEQATATELICRRACHVAAILPTGGGKSITYLTAVKKEASRGMTTIYLAPMVALVEDQRRICTEYGLQSVRWQEGGHGVQSGTYAMVLGTFDACDNESFVSYVRRMADQGKIGRIVIDEAHYPHRNANFRENMANLTEVTTLGLPVVMLSATLAPTDVPAMCKFLHIPREHVAEVRARTARKNIRYEVQLSAFSGDADQRAIHAMETFEHVLQRLKLTLGPDCLGLLYPGSKTVADAIAKQGKNAWVHYTGGMTENDRTRSIRAFGRTHFRMSCTSAFSVGVDNPGIRFVMHYDVPWSVVDFVQESGRAGRAGQKAYSVVVLVKPQASGKGSTNRQVMETSLYASRQCRRAVLDLHMDGLALNCLSHGPGTILCDACEPNVAEAAAVARPEVPPIAPTIVHEHAGNAQQSPVALPPDAMEVDDAPRDEWQPSRPIRKAPKPPTPDPKVTDHEDMVVEDRARPATPPLPPPLATSMPHVASPIFTRSPKPKPKPSSKAPTTGAPRPSSSRPNPPAPPPRRPPPAGKAQTGDMRKDWPECASHPRNNPPHGPRIFDDALLDYIRSIVCPICVLAGHGPGVDHGLWNKCPHWKSTVSTFTDFPMYHKFRQAVVLTPSSGQPGLCTFCWLPKTSPDYHNSEVTGISGCWHSDKVMPMMYALWKMPELNKVVLSGTLAPGYDISSEKDWTNLLSMNHATLRQDISFGIVRIFAVEVPKWLSSQGKWPHKMVVNEMYSNVEFQ